MNVSRKNMHTLNTCIEKKTYKWLLIHPQALIPPLKANRNRYADNESLQYVVGISVVFKIVRGVKNRIN
jgi:hypothetical protein